MMLENFLNRRTVLTAGSALLFGAALSPLRAQTNGGKLPVGTIGAGHIGSTIGGLWVKSGHKVLFSSRHPEELKDLVAGLGPLAQAGTVEQAIAFGDVVLLTVPYGALPQIGRDYTTQLKGKIVLDTCNAASARDGAVADEVEANGIGLISQKYLPGTRLVRAFNTISYKIFAAKRTGPIRNSPCRSPATIKTPSGSPRRLYATPVSIPWSSVSLPTPSSFSAAGPAMGSRSARPN